MTWELTDLGSNKCTVKMSLDYNFKSSLQKMVAGPIFEKLQNQIVPSFEKKCSQNIKE